MTHRSLDDKIKKLQREVNLLWFLLGLNSLSILIGFFL